MAELKCPNCGEPAAAGDAGKTIVCAKCGGRFKFISGEAKLQSVSDFDRLRADIEELKQRLPASVPAKETPADPPEDPDDDLDVEGGDDDEDL